MKNFYIKKNSTLPILKFPLNQKLMEKYDISEEMLANVAVTFSMRDKSSGLYMIANSPADLVVNDDREEYPDERKYTLTYKFKISNTKKTGNYIGEFKLDFLGDYCGKITLPNSGDINIIINDSITKTEIV